MNDSPFDLLTSDQITILTELAEKENTHLEDAASAVTQQAFNLGCLVGLLPGVIFLLISILLTGFSVIGTAISLVLILVGLIAFANLAAMLARRNTIRRIYYDQSQGEIEHALQQAGLNREQFDIVARQTLHPQAALYSFLHVPNPLSITSNEPGSSKEKQT